MNELLALSFIAACIAGVVSYIVAYDRAWSSGSRHQARKLALRATPGPIVYYLVLGVLVSVIAPHFVNRH